MRPIWEKKDACRVTIGGFWGGERVGVLKSDLRFTGICELRRKEKKGGDEAFGGDNGRYPK